MTAFVRTLSSLALACACSLTAAAAQQKPSAPPPRIPDAIFVDKAPEDAKCVAEVKKSAKKGDEVVIAAKIGGRVEPFVRNRAMFLIADRCLKSCDEIPGDTCTKPWDYCCESPESLKANTATVIIVGADGKPLKCAAQGVGGLEPLALVVIEGKVVDRDDKGVFIIEARRIHVEPKKDGRGEKDPKAANAGGKSGAEDGPKEVPAETPAPPAPSTS